MCLDIQSFSERMDQFQLQIDRMELRLNAETAPSRDVASSSPTHCESTQFSVLKHRLLRVEQRLDAGSPAVSFPDSRIDALDARIVDVESNCTRVAMDSFAAIESMHAKLDLLHEAVRKNLSELDQDMSTRLSESIAQVTCLITKLVEAHKMAGTQL